MADQVQDEAAQEPKSFEEIFRVELRTIQQGRKLREESDQDPQDVSPVDSPYPRANEMNMWGLVFSGGGVRSATFNLGVLQGLAKLGLLKKFDYLSTVSGGGYIGSWFSAWIHQQAVSDGTSTEKAEAAAQRASMAAAKAKAAMEAAKEAAKEAANELERAKAEGPKEAEGDSEEGGWLDRLWPTGFGAAWKSFWEGLWRQLKLDAVEEVYRQAGRAAEAARVALGHAREATTDAGWRHAETAHDAARQARESAEEAAKTEGGSPAPDEAGIQPLPPVDERKIVESMDKVVRKLHPEPRRAAPDEDDNPEAEPKEIRHIRAYSNYLTPRKNLFGADMQTLVATYLLNMLLNLSKLVLVLSALLLVPYLFTYLFVAVSKTFQPMFLSGIPYIGWGLLKELYEFDLFLPHWILPLLSFLLLFWANFKMVQDLENLFVGSSRNESRASRPGLGRMPLQKTKGQVRVGIVLPVLASGWILSAWLWAQASNYGSEAGLAWYWWVLGVGVANALLWVFGSIFGELLRFRTLEEEEERSLKAEETEGIGGSADGTAARSKTGRILAKAGKELHWFRRGFSRFREERAHKKALLGYLALGGFSLLSGGVGSWFLLLVLKILSGWSKDEGLASSHFIAGTELAASFGPPMVVGVFLLAAMVQVGLLGRDLSNEMREWWGRMVATIGIWTAVVAGFFALGLLGPKLFSGPLERLQSETTDKGTWVYAVLILLWLIPSGLGVLAGARSTSGEGAGQKKLKWAVVVSPYIFILGFLFVLAYFAQRIRDVLSGDGETFISDVLHLATMPFGQMFALVGAIVALIGISLFLSWRVGINEFSMHALYRNRLVRTFLGAVRKRDAHPFTDFDPDDDNKRVLDFHPERNYPGPYLIINSAINLAGSDVLAVQHRKAMSFVFTPGFCGFEVNAKLAEKGPDLLDKGYRDSMEYGGRLSLGTAMATSGAAASPNMGQYSSGSLGFLMTIFNVRLGWWLGNPRHKSKWKRGGPTLGLWFLLMELIGNTRDNADYVYLSDGGHFENLGLYELVRRRCQFIVVGDASADPEMKFADLGSAIEKCRLDFGVAIEINVDELQPVKGGRDSQWHCAIGRIRYDKVDPKTQIGTLLYLKPSLIGDEPLDVKRYAARKPEFPHQSTADQWFDEAQFEAYRALGQRVAVAAFEEVGNETKLETMSHHELLRNLQHRWHPASTAVAESFTRHTATVDEIFRTIGETEELHFMDEQLFREMCQVDPARWKVKNIEHWLPPTSEEVRAGFYLSNRVIQLMENVYLDLNLEEEHGHPDNRGWMNFFRRWAWSGMFRITFAISASAYGARFQAFAEKHLGLEPRNVKLGSPFELSHVDKERRKVLDQSVKKKAINPYERELLYTLGSWYHSDNQEQGVECGLWAVPIQVSVKDPVSSNVPVDFTCGVIVYAPEAVDEQGKDGKLEESKTKMVVRYFRVEDHLRKVGLGREGLRDFFANTPKDDPVVPLEGFEANFEWLDNGHRDKAELKLIQPPSNNERVRFELAFHSVLAEVNGE